MTVRWQYASFALGISVCLIAAFLMFEGSVLGENTTGWVTVILIVGIGLIATSGPGLLKPKES
jgi:tellurite resistance protein TehA-like permease